MKIYIGAEVEFVEFCDLYACLRVIPREKAIHKELERESKCTYFYRLLCQIIHSFKHFIIIVLNRRYVGKCKYFYSNFVPVFRFCSVKHATMRPNPIGFFFFHFFSCFTMLCKSRTWQNVWLLLPSVALYFIFMVSNVSDVAIYLHLIFFSLIMNKSAQKMVDISIKIVRKKNHAYLFILVVCVRYGFYCNFSWIGNLFSTFLLVIR